MKASVIEILDDEDNGRGTEVDDGSEKTEELADDELSMWPALVLYKSY